MTLTKILFSCFLLFVTTFVFGQKIVYSEPEPDETRRLTFEVVGKVSGNFLVYKNNRGRNYVSVYDNNMKLLNKVEYKNLPDDRLINVDFFPYNDFAYMIYQYQRKNVVYCNAVKIDGEGNRVGKDIFIDTTHIGFAADNKIYSVLSSEDKSKIMVFKINSRNRDRFVLTTLLHDQQLSPLKRTVIPIAMEERQDYLDEFGVDNEGDFIFTKFTRGSNDNIAKALLMWKPALSDSMAVTDLGLDKFYLDELHLKIDNINKRYFLTSFYYQQKRGNIDGFYFFVWDKRTMKPAMENRMTFSENLRTEARGDASIKTAFNDYFIRNIIIKKDGGFIIGSEAYYTSSRGNNWNRWDYLYGSPFNVYDYYSYSPVFNSWYWRSRYNNNQAVRHHADNITVLSFDKAGQLEWSNVINKEQFDDQAGDYISYNLLNSGGQLHVLFNLEEKRQQLLNDYTVTVDGQVTRNPTLKNLDRGFEFLPKYGKQVSARQMIIPCYYRNFVCFAKIDFNS